MMPHITGTTRIYGLVGDPLDKAKSPELLNRLFLEQGADAVCVPFVVKDDALSAFAAGARTMGNLSGLLVTMPHKQRMMALVDDLDPTSAQVGALNVIRCNADGRWVGAIFDGVGCVLGMQWEGNHPAGRSVLLVGAGGAGRAIAFAVAAASAKTLTIADVDARRAEDLAGAVAAATGREVKTGRPDPRGFDIVINATPMGMSPGDPMPIDPEQLVAGQTVVDIINSPTPTSLCVAAHARGCRTQNGHPMHQGQAVHALRFLGFEYCLEGRSMSDAQSVSASALSIER